MEIIKVKKLFILSSIFFLFFAQIDAMNPGERDQVRKARQAWLRRREQIRQQNEVAGTRRDAEENILNEDCPICMVPFHALGQHQAYRTTCCNQLICKTDIDKLEQNAQELFQRLNDSQLRREFAESADFTGWPEADIDGRCSCPFCRIHPLRVQRAIPTHNEVESAPEVQEVQHVRVPQRQEECGICLQEVNVQEFIDLHCGHRFCTACLRYLVDSAIRGRNTQQLRCPHPECVEQMNDLDIDTIISFDKEKREKIDEIKANEWVTNQGATVRQCPTPNCPIRYLYEHDTENPEPIKCPGCNQQYCPNCGILHDRNLTCTQAANGNTETDNSDIRANREWIEKNTRACPTCGTRIHKFEGCDYVKCTNCEHAFCFNCLEIDPIHHFCNKPRAASSTQAHANQERQQAERAHPQPDPFMRRTTQAAYPDNPQVGAWGIFPLPKQPPYARRQENPHQEPWLLRPNYLGRPENVQQQAEQYQEVFRGPQRERNRHEREARLGTTQNHYGNFNPHEADQNPRPWVQRTSERQRAFIVVQRTNEQNEPEMLVSFMHPLSDNDYRNFITTLNQLLDDNRERPSFTVNTEPQGRRFVIFNTRLSQEAFQNILDEANRRCFQ